jgi:DNA-binding response OmpR family regulator
MPAAAAKKILLVDDDDNLRRTLAEQLALDGEFEATEAATATEGLQKAKAAQFDVILLDVGLPDGDGRELDTIRGLDSGANDYVTKPFRLGELVARVRAHLRQHEHSEDAVLHIGPYVFKPAVKMLVEEAAKKKIRLTEKEAAILKYLYRAGQKSVSRETLLGEVWGYNAGVTTHTLETHVYRLRQKIEKDLRQPAILVTDQGGYRLVP